MQRVLSRATLLAAGLLALTGGTARAAVVEVKVPFPFVVKGQQFPAGEYRLQRDQTDSSVVLIRGGQQRRRVRVDNAGRRTRSSG
jgi:hypothetical protein